MTSKSLFALATVLGLAVSGAALADSSKDGEQGDDNGGSNYQWQDGEQGHSDDRSHDQWQEGERGHSDGGSNDEWYNRDHGDSDTNSRSRVYMGMSDKAPPNANAANSQGTRTEVTTWRGHRHHYNRFGDRWNWTDRSVTITDYPGKNR